MFGENLKKYRLEKGYSQNDIAEKLYVTRQCVSKWEKEITQPDLQTLAKLAELLDISVDELLTGETDPIASSEKYIERNRVLFISNILTALFCVLAFVAIWRFLPKTVPAHWTHGVLDRWGSRNEIFLNTVTTAVFLVVDIIVFFALRRGRCGKALFIFIPHCVIMLFQIANVVLIIALYAATISDVLSFVTCLTADLLLQISIATHPKLIKQNLVLGVRTAETLRSPTIWNKANALGCYLFSGCSLSIFTVAAVWITDFPYLFLTAYILPAPIVLIYIKFIGNKKE